jgi:hypothetical protein
LYGRASILLLALIAAAVGCGGGSAHVPHGSQIPRNLTPTPAPTSSFTMTAAQVTTALQGVQTTYQTLPHTSLRTDLSTLAAAMVSSKTYRSAIVVPGGIAAKLTDGTPVLVFADRMEDLGGASASARLRTSVAPHRLDLPLSAPNAHEIALLVNESDTSGAFMPVRQMAYGNAFTQSGFGASTGYGVDAVDVTIENLAAIGSGHPIDFLGMATHGVIGSDPDMPLATNTYYAWLLSTPITAALITQYQNDYNAGNLISAIYITLQKQTATLVTFAFTPTFLTEQVHFNPGAILDNQSCWGQSPIIASNVQGVLQTANVGRYIGWTKEVGGNDADQTDAFIFDRMLGEQSPSVTGLDSFANQRTPPQRPFPLDDIETAMGAETRNSPIEVVNEPYTLSDNGYAINASAPPSADGTAARLIITDFGGESVANPPIEYSLPSISQLQVVENPSNGALTILGSFPATPGNVQIRDAGGTYPLAPTAWATDHVTVTLPQGGSGSAGLVKVFYGTPGSSSVIASNEVPLTQWSGSLVYNESDLLSTLGGQAGSGTGTLHTTFNIDFRADVHPVVPQIDFSPEPQNLTFNSIEGDSFAEITAFNGTFTSGGTDPHTATFALVPTGPIMVPAPTPLPPSTFDIGALAGQPSSCNNGLSGPQSGPTNVLCPSVGFRSQNTGSCTDDDSGDFCPLAFYSPSVGFGLPSGGVGGLLTFTMDPATYAITVTSTTATFERTESMATFGGTGTASMNGSFQPPFQPPTSTTPAARRAKTPFAPRSRSGVRTQ